MEYQSKAAEIGLRLEKAQRKTAQAKAYFASFQVGDRVEVTTHKGAKQGQIILTHPKYLTVKFDGHGYKTTLSRADYLSKQYQIKKIEGEDKTMAQRIEAPSRDELEVKLLSHQGSINKLAKEYGVSWGKAREWLIEHDLMETRRSQLGEGVEEVQGPVESNGEFESLVIEEVKPAEPEKPTEPAEQEELVEELDLSDALNILYDGQERVEYVLGLVLQRLDALEQKVDQLPTSAQVEFKDVADLAERMHRVWTDARR